MDWGDFKKEKLTSISTIEGKCLDDEAVLIHTAVMARKEKNLTHPELAVLSGVDVSVISAFEMCAEMPSLTDTVKISVALGLKLEMRPRVWTDDCDTVGFKFTQDADDYYRTEIYKNGVHVGITEAGGETWEMLIGATLQVCKMAGIPLTSNIMPKPADLNWEQKDGVRIACCTASIPRKG